MPTYVLSKVKRTGAGQPVADLVDVDANANPPAALTLMGSGDHIVILDEDDGKAFKIVTQSNFITQLNALVCRHVGTPHGCAEREHVSARHCGARHRSADASRNWNQSRGDGGRRAGRAGCVARQRAGGARHVE